MSVPSTSCFIASGPPRRRRCRLGRIAQLGPLRLAITMGCHHPPAQPPSAHLRRPGLALFTSRQLPCEILDVLAVEPEFLRLHPRGGPGPTQGVAAGSGGGKPATGNGAPGDGARARCWLRHGAWAGEWGGIRYPGLKEQFELLNPRQNDLPPLLEKIRLVLYVNHVIPANTPLPATSIARGLTRRE